MFYDQLKKLCEKRNIKITPLVKSLGMSTGGIKRWRDGVAPNGDTLLKFSEYFNVSTDYLLTGKDNKSNEGGTEDISIEEFAERQGITNDEDIRNLKYFFELMKKKNYNAELDEEFISKEYSMK